MHPGSQLYGGEATAVHLSASVAHEVNQPLAAILANAQACQRWLAADPPNQVRAQAIVERIVRDATIAAQLVDRVRALFSRDEPDRAPIDLNDLIAEALASLVGDLREREIALVVALGRPRCPLLLDRVQILRLLVNLMRNALEAMSAQEGPRLLEVVTRYGSSGVHVIVGDSGRGVAEGERMFEPFFTTRKGGMGIGLPLCRSIVEAHGGRLWTKPNAPAGTRMIFTLPAAATPCPAGEARHA